MNEDIAAKIEAQQKKLDEIYRSIERMRKYFLWTLMITVAAVLLPLLGLAIVIPQFLSTYNTSSLGL